MSNLHKDWIRSAVAEGLARIEEANVTVKGVPNKGDLKLIPFEKIIFTIDTEAEGARLMAIAEAGRGTTTDDDGKEVPKANPVADLVTYAYGLNCRAKVRADFESKFEDPEKAIKAMAKLLVKSGRFKSEEKALAAARLLQEDDDEEDEA